MWTKYQIMLEGRTVQEEHLRAQYPQQGYVEKVK